MLGRGIEENQRGGTKDIGGLVVSSFGCRLEDLDNLAIFSEFF